MRECWVIEEQDKETEEWFAVDVTVDREHAQHAQAWVSNYPHRVVRYVPADTLAQLDAARAREQRMREELAEIGAALNDPADNLIATTAQCITRLKAREAKLREKAQVICNFTVDNGSTEYFVEWLVAMNDLRAALAEAEDGRG